MEKQVYIFIVMLIGGMVSLSAQVTDSNNSSLSLPAATNPDADNSPSSLDIKPLNNSGLSLPNTNRVNGMSIPNSSTNNTNSQFSMFEKESFGNPGELQEKRISKLTKELERKADESVTGKTTDQYLGDFKTKSKSVTVAYRDYGGIDGDRIRVFVEGDVIRPNELLRGTFSSFKIDLITGFNKIDFQALNQGDVGPNTAELLVIDEEGNVLASDYWALATGVKASIIVIKE